MFTKYTQFVIRVQKLLKGDSIIVMLLIVITLFSADRTVVEEKEKVRIPVRSQDFSKEGANPRGTANLLFCELFTEPYPHKTVSIVLNNCES